MHPSRTIIGNLQESWIDDALDHAPGLDPLDAPHHLPCGGSQSIQLYAHRTVSEHLAYLATLRQGLTEIAAMLKQVEAEWGK